MIIIDGSFGEGGGQILRTALSLAAILKTPITVENIRRGRKKPGLQPQHLTGVRAVAKICQGNLSGDTLSSDKLTLEPGEIRSGVYDFDISEVAPSAGSITMVLEQILPLLIFGKEASIVTLKGGTNVAWSPPIEFLNYVFLPAVKKMGIDCSLEIQKWGFFPVGGGLVKATISPLVGAVQPINMTERGNLKSLKGLALAANLPISIAEREVKQAQKFFYEKGLSKIANLEARSVPAAGSGNSFFLLAEYERCPAGFSALGELGKLAEKVADEALVEFLKFDQSGAAIEKHLMDQLLLYLALAQGRSRIAIPEITNHAKTNLWAIEQLLPVKFEVSENSIAVEGVGRK